MNNLKKCLLREIRYNKHCIWEIIFQIKKGTSIYFLRDYTNYLNSYFKELIKLKEFYEILKEIVHEVYWNDYKTWKMFTSNINRGKI